MNRPLNPLERSWLMLESKSTPMHLGALLTFKLPKASKLGAVGKLVADLRAATETVAPWNQTLKRGLRPHWIEDNDLDMEYHVRHSALPAPGGERELGVLISRLHSHSLDLSRPPWECHVIEGLEDGRFALYIKMHHTLTDVASFQRMLTNWLSESAKQRNAPAPWTLDAGPSEREEAGDRLMSAVRSFLQPDSVLTSATEMGNAFGRLLRAGLKPAGDLRAPYRAPHSALNVRIGPQRRFATQQYKWKRLEAAADGSGSSVRDLVMYICATALRRFFKEYNALPDKPFIAAVPGMRMGLPMEGAEDESVYGSVGLVSLGTQHADPRKRLAEIHRSSQASRDHLDAVPEELAPLFTLASMSPYVLGQVSGMNRVLPTMFNLTISDQPGPHKPLYYNGARLQSLYPMFPLIQGGALSITCVHYADSLNIGICGARETLPSLQRMAVYMEQALVDLEEAIASKESAGEAA